MTTPQAPVYLDNAATTPMRPEAIAAMLPFLGEQYGNPTGSHAMARAARAALEAAFTMSDEALADFEFAAPRAA